MYVLSWENMVVIGLTNIDFGVHTTRPEVSCLILHRSSPGMTVAGPRRFTP